MLCDYAVADITGANPNVFYELGIRHAMRPRSTVILFAEGTMLPFDIALVRGIAYQTDEHGEPIDPKSCASRVTNQLSAARDNPHDDSPMFQLSKTCRGSRSITARPTSFASGSTIRSNTRTRLAAAPRKGAEAVQEVLAEPALSNLHEVESGIVVDLFLSLRDVKAYTGMIELSTACRRRCNGRASMREQYGFALNREGRSQEAEAVLKEVMQEFGPSSETNGLLGRVYKDRWDGAKKEGRNVEARGLLRNAIDTYLAGFQADWRDAYPGINAVTLMEMQDKPDPRQAEILPVVRYAALQKAKRSVDYWDHATLMELAVIGRDLDDAEEKLSDSLASAPSTAPWQLETTERQMRLIRELREKRGEEDAAGIKVLEEALHEKRLALEAAQKKAS